MQIFHLAFKQFTENFQVVVFQLLNSMEKVGHFFAMNLRLNLSTQNIVSHTLKT